MGDPRFIDSSAAVLAGGRTKPIAALPPLGTSRVLSPCLISSNAELADESSVGPLSCEALELSSLFFFLLILVTGWDFGSWQDAWRNGTDSFSILVSTEQLL